MSNFLENLSEKINNCYHEEQILDEYGCVYSNCEDINSAFELLNSLGENARRMLSIGEVMDELVELGFESCPDSSIVFKKELISILFLYSKFIIYKSDSFESKFTSEIYRCDYTQPTWQQDLLAKVRELINV